MTGCNDEPWKTLFYSRRKQSSHKQQQQDPSCETYVGTVSFQHAGEVDEDTGELVQREHEQETNDGKCMNVSGRDAAWKTKKEIMEHAGST